MLSKAERLEINAQNAHQYDRMLESLKQQHKICEVLDDKAGMEEIKKRTDDTLKRIDQWKMLRAEIEAEVE